MFLRRYLILVKLIFVAIIFYYMVKKSMLQVGLFSTFIFSPRLFMLMTFLLTANVLLSAYRWYIIVTSLLGIVSFRSILLSTYTGLAYNNVLPGNVSGDFIRAHYLYRSVPDKAGYAITTVLYDRLMGLLGLGLLFLFQAIYYYHLLNTISLTMLLVGCAGIVMLVMFLSSKYLSSYIIPFIFNRSIFSNKKWLNRMALAYKLGFSRLLFVQTLLISVLIQLIISAMLYFTFSFFNIATVEYLQTLFASTITQLVSLIPVAPGGLGLSEASFGHVMIIISHSKIVAFSTVYITYRFFSMLMTSPGLLLALAGDRHKATIITTPLVTSVE